MREKFLCGFYLQVSRECERLREKIGEPSRHIIDGVLRTININIALEMKDNKEYHHLVKELRLTPFEACSIVAHVEFDNRNITQVLKLVGIIPNANPEQRTREACLSIGRRLISGELEGKLKVAYEDYYAKLVVANNEGKFASNRRAIDGKLSTMELMQKATRFPAALAIFEYMKIAPNVNDIKFLESVKYMSEFDGVDMSNIVPTTTAYEG